VRIQSRRVRADEQVTRWFWRCCDSRRSVGESRSTVSAASRQCNTLFTTVWWQHTGGGLRGPRRGEHRTMLNSSASPPSASSGGQRRWNRSARWPGANAPRRLRRDLSYGRKRCVLSAEAVERKLLATRQGGSVAGR
jgi:hypothetical protein